MASRTGRALIHSAFSAPRFPAEFSSVHEMDAHATRSLSRHETAITRLAVPLGVADANYGSTLPSSFHSVAQPHASGVTATDNHATTCRRRYVKVMIACEACDCTSVLPRSLHTLIV